MKETMTPDQHKKLWTLNVVETAVGCFVGIMTIVSLAFSVMAVFVLIPYRVNQLENAQTVIRTEMSSMRAEQYKNQELLIRMDERLKTLQRAMKIPTEEQ